MQELTNQTCLLAMMGALGIEHMPQPVQKQGLALRKCHFEDLGSAGKGLCGNGEECGLGW